MKNLSKLITFILLWVVFSINVYAQHEIGTHLSLMGSQSLTERAGFISVGKQLDYKYSFHNNWFVNIGGGVHHFQGRGSIFYIDYKEQAFLNSVSYYAGIGYHIFNSPNFRFGLQLSYLAAHVERYTFLHTNLDYTEIYSYEKSFKAIHAPSIAFDLSYKLTDRFCVKYSQWLAYSDGGNSQPNILINSRLGFGYIF